MSDVSLNCGLVGYWPMDEGSGSTTTRDDSGWKNTGTLTNITDSNWKDGISGKCIEFNGTDEYVDCGTDDSIKLTQSGWTVSVWIYPHNAAGSSPNRNSIYITGSNTWWIVLDSNDIVLQELVGYTEISSYANDIQSNNWYHVVVTSSGNTKNIYVNGSIVKTGNLTVANATYSNIAYAYTGTDMFDGKIDEVRIYNRDLNTDEIEYLHSHPSGVNKNLVSARLLITDLDGYGHTITDNIEFLEVSNALTYASDTFEIILANYDDYYSYIKFGCDIEIWMGIGGYNSKKLTGIVTDAVYTLDNDLVDGRIELVGEDIGYRANNLYVFNVIQDKEISAILLEVLDSVDITTGQTIRQLADIDSSNEYIESTIYTSESTTFAWSSLSKAINELAEYAGYEWYIDVNKKLHFFESIDVAISAIITDDDLVGNPRISTYKKPINRAIVFGGYNDKNDQVGLVKSTTCTVTDTCSRESSFVPTHNLLSSVYVWTELVTGSDSNIVLTIEDASSNVIANSLKTVYKNGITDGDYTKFDYTTFVALVEGRTYYIHMEGTDSNGVKVGYGIGGPTGTIIDYITTYPARVASVVNDMDSYDEYGLNMDVFIDTSIEDFEMATLKSISMLNGGPKKSAVVSITDDSVSVGDIITLNITKDGIKINKTMKVMNSTLKAKHRYIENCLELEEI